MTEKGNTWLNISKYTKDYTEEVDLFVKIAMAKFVDGNEIYNIMNPELDTELDTGFQDNFDEMLNVMYDKMGPNEDAKRFYQLVEEGKQPLYPGYPNHKWRSDKRRFDGNVEAGTSAPTLTDRQIEILLNGYENDFSGVGKKMKSLADYIKRFKSPDTKAKKSGEELRGTKTKKVGEGLPDPKAKTAAKDLPDPKTKKAGEGLPDPKTKIVGEELGKIC
ncbi:hypothetical protein POM88_018481 [Heracleum sosnowskyi]|uniref:Uncharacterized protein n=1 Tax=Heracleum sosnowskyi TaxID=360622 RepID=A0AAD8N0F4_9APIA|nr:hypothetical protein POM88_018481 [Heracleum sosnowskyi]